ncbi:hypothetical protein GCM10011357_14850 [Lacimicrobium alkaliphilum]|uniref:Uncharacterized protein n=1 Tax=Lacimicrobium alkaliphilum TaxID=1526571 RepID=A0ABQ1RAM1_9ALTE|nr:hypothetical protein GCM10011357_14850 [Lacimicrobium alkaliphilum]
MTLKLIAILMVLAPSLLILLIVKVAKITGVYFFLAVFILSYLFMYPVELIYCYFVGGCEPHHLNALGKKIYYILVVITTLIGQLVVQKYLKKNKV